MSAEVESPAVTTGPVVCKTWCYAYGTPAEGHAGLRTAEDQMCTSPARHWAGDNAVSACFHHASRGLAVHIDEGKREGFTLTPEDAAGLLVALRRVMKELELCGDA